MKKNIHNKSGSLSHVCFPDICNRVDEKITAIVNKDPSKYMLAKEDPDYVSLMRTPPQHGHTMTEDEINTMLSFEFNDVVYHKDKYVSCHYDPWNDPFVEELKNIPLDEWVDFAAQRFIEQNRKVISYELQLMGNLQLITSDHALFVWCHGTERRCRFTEFDYPEPINLVRIPVSQTEDKLYAERAFPPSIGPSWEFVGHYDRKKRILTFS